MEVTAPTDWSKVVDPVMEEGYSGNSRYLMDSKLYVQFYLRPILQPSASNEAKRPIFKDTEHVRILVPGDKLSIVDRVASDDDRQRFADHYAKFKAGRGDEIVGTRLEAVPWMTRSKVEEYKYFGIHTVEQLSEASDSVGQKFPGFHQDRERCKAFLEATTGTNARVSELEKQLAELRAQLPQPKVAAKV